MHSRLVALPKSPDLGEWNLGPCPYPGAGTRPSNGIPSRTTDPRGSDEQSSLGRALGRGPSTLTPSALLDVASSLAVKERSQRRTSRRGLYTAGHDLLRTHPDFSVQPFVGSAVGFKRRAVERNTGKESRGAGVGQHVGRTAQRAGGAPGPAAALTSLPTFTLPFSTLSTALGAMMAITMSLDLPPT